MHTCKTFPEINATHLIFKSLRIKELSTSFYLKSSQKEEKAKTIREACSP